MKFDYVTIKKKLNSDLTIPMFSNSKISINSKIPSYI